jgi:hypothetical protein
MIYPYRMAAQSLILIVACGLGLVANGQTRPTPGYHLVGQISTDSGDLGFLALDTRSRQLYGAGDGVINIDSNKVVSHLDLPEHGVLIASELRRGLGMNGALFELPSHRLIDSLHTDGYTSAYDPYTGRAFLFRRLTVVVDVRGGHVIDTLDLGGDPASGVADGRGRVFVNRADADSVVVIDTRVPRIVAHWPVAPCTKPRGLAIDALHERLFIACEHALEVLSARDGHVVADVENVRGGQEIAFDSTTGLIFNSSGVDNGATMSVIRESSSDEYSIVDQVPIGHDGGIKLIVDSRTHRVYLATAHMTPLNTVYIFAPR